MPRKTRKEKMSAQLRSLKRKISTNQSDLEEDTIQIPTTPKYTFEPKQKITERQRVTKSNYSYVYSELKQVGILIVITLVFQVGLNLTLRTDFAKLLLSSLGIEI